MTGPNLTTKTHNFLNRSRRAKALIALMRLVENREIYALAANWALYTAGNATPTYHTRDIQDLIARGLISTGYSEQHREYRPLLTEFGTNCMTSATVRP